MGRRPIAATIFGVLLTATGCIAFAAHVWPFVAALASGQAPRESRLDLIYITISEAAAVSAGVGLLLGAAWARWLAAAWMGAHVVLSIGHSTSQLIVHLVLFIAIVVFLFRPTASPPDQRVRHETL